MFGISHYLAHNGATTTDTTTCVCATTRLENGDDGGGGVGGKAEPEESGRGLRFPAALGGISRTVGDQVAVDVFLWQMS